MVPPNQLCSDKKVEEFLSCLVYYTDNWKQPQVIQTVNMVCECYVMESVTSFYKWKKKTSMPYQEAFRLHMIRHVHNARHISL